MVNNGQLYPGPQRVKIPKMYQKIKLSNHCATNRTVSLVKCLKG